MKKYKIAIVGATGNVGRETIRTLYERNFPIKEIIALASKRSVRKEISFGEEKILTVQDVNDYDFTGTDIAFFCGGTEVAKRFALKATQEGCIVIDNSAYFRMDPDVPLVIPEINPDALALYTPYNIIANPNCATIQMLMALAPLHKTARIKRVVMVTYQSVSGAGKEAMDELYNQTKSMYMYDKKSPQYFTKQIAFNLIPHIDDFLADGSTKEEDKIRRETHKIMEEDIKVSVTCVRVPVFKSHAEAIHVEFHDAISVQNALNILEDAPGVVIMDRPEENIYATPIDVVQEDGVYVSRIRKDDTVEHGLILWVVSDNLRKGAALNAVQIAELLNSTYLQ